MRNFFCLVSFLFLFSILLSNVSAICINSADNYAAEVLLSTPKASYNFDSLDSAKNIIIDNNRYVLQSEYHSNLALILEEQTSPISGLSIRLQIPVKSKEENLPYLKFSSTSAKGTLNISGEIFHDGWKISCIQGISPAQCEFVKGKTEILALLSSKKYEISIGTREELKDCKNCDGRCISNTGKCLSLELKNDIEKILQYTGLVSSIDELFSQYKVITSGSAVITDLTPENLSSINWQEAMKNELSQLKKQLIISIEDVDIEGISQLAMQGMSGQNSRIMYGEDKNSEKRWLYYYEIKLPILTKLENCLEFPKSLVPTSMIIFNERSTISTYYLIPLIFTSALIFILAILITAARIIESKKIKKARSIIGLQSN